jgi:hypothetical protein
MATNMRGLTQVRWLVRRLLLLLMGSASSSQTFAGPAFGTWKRNASTRRWRTYERSLEVRDDSFWAEATYRVRSNAASLDQMAIWTATRRKSEQKPPARFFVSFSVPTRFRRYVAKVLYTYILGYKVDVGHMEAVNLISSPKYSEKQIVSALVLGV